MNTESLNLKEIIINNTRLAYTDNGQGSDVIVLIHGSLCDYRYWKWQIPELAKHFRVIAPSLRHYAPIPLTSVDDFSYQQHSQDIAALLQQLEISKAHILGHSRGAAVALDLALTTPQSISSLILADPGIRDHQQLQEGIAFKKEALQLIHAGKLDEGLALFIDSVSGEGTYKKMVRWFKEMVRENAHTLFLQRYEKPFLISSTLESLKLPITLMGGSDSPAPFPEINRTLQTLWPQAKSFVLTPASHGMNLALPHEFNHIIIEHINSYNQSLTV